MKIIKSLTILILSAVFFLPAELFAWWYNLNWYTHWTTTKTYRNCPSSAYLILDQHRNRNTGRSVNAWARGWSQYCYLPDNTWPTIYTYLYEDKWSGWVRNDAINNNWSKAKRVYLRVRSVDSQAWVWIVRINGINVSNGMSIYDWVTVKYWSATDYYMIFEREWIYKMTFDAWDNARHTWNLWYYQNRFQRNRAASKTITIKIDRSAPIVQIDSAWVTLTDNGRLQVNYKVKDEYEGKQTMTRKFNCGTLPPNASRESNQVNDRDNTITWYCIPSNTRTCSADSQYSPNKSLCWFTCNNGYVKWNDNKCHIETITKTCDPNILPSNVYYYNSGDNLTKWWSADKYAVWSSPNTIDQSNGTFPSLYQKNTDDYYPDTNTCWFTCWNGYHKEWTKCVNDTKMVCCTEPYLSASTSGTRVDCTLDINKNDPQCNLSSVCDYAKELLGIWQYDRDLWSYATTSKDKDWKTIIDNQVYWESWKAEICAYTYFDHSDGKVCDPYYYLLKVNNKPVLCDEVPEWYYSWASNSLFECTNKPDHSYYTSNSNSNNCNWECNTWYNKSWNSCIIQSSSSSSSSSSTSTSTSSTSSGWPVLVCPPNRPNCWYSYDKVWYNDKNCTDVSTTQAFGWNGYETLVDCENRQQDKFDKYQFNTCVKSWRNYYKRTMTDYCEDSLIEQ